MRLTLELDNGELNALQFPVVVEQWKKIRDGKQRRAFFKEFSESERAKAKYWYNHFYRWYFTTETPDCHHFRPETLNFVKRLCNFFGTL